MQTRALAFILVLRYKARSHYCVTYFYDTLLTVHILYTRRTSPFLGSQKTDNNSSPLPCSVSSSTLWSCRDASEAWKPPPAGAQRVLGGVGIDPERHGLPPAVSKHGRHRYSAQQLSAPSKTLVHSFKTALWLLSLAFTFICLHTHMIRLLLSFQPCPKTTLYEVIDPFCALAFPHFGGSWYWKLSLRFQRCVSCVIVPASRGLTRWVTAVVAFPCGKLAGYYVIRP